MARHLTLVPAPVTGAGVLPTVWPAVRACLSGDAPLAVLPAGPVPAVATAQAVLRAAEPLEDGADLVVLTSGSTGGGRGVLLSAAALRASATATLDRLGGPGSWLLTLPTSAIAGLQVLVRSALADRVPAVLQHPAEQLGAALARMPDGDRRYTALVPTQLRRYLDTDPESLARFDAVLVGGAATDPGLLARARAAGVQVRTTYGMSETAGGCVYDGQPLDGVRVRVDDRGVQLAGPTLALGYRLDPAATAAAFRDGWFHTRDAGSLDDAGLLTVHGRLDDVVISGGVNVAPQAVEAVLREHPQVADAVVTGRPDPEWGQRVVAGIVPAGPDAPTLEQLRDWVAGRLGPAAAPRDVVLLAAVPVLHTGKPDRRSVARLIVPESQSAGDLHAGTPSTPERER